MERVLITSANMGRTQSNKCINQNGYEVTFKCYNNTNFSVRQNSLHPRTVGKIPKMLAWELHPGYDYYIWIDSIFNITRDDSVQWFINQLKGRDAAFFKHPGRNTVQSELDFCIDRMNEGDQYLLVRYANERMQEQVEKYFKDGFVDNVLMAAGAFIYTSHLVSDPTFNVMKEWFYHNCLYSVQDQLSLPYLLQKFNVNYSVINENIYDCIYIH